MRVTVSVIFSNYGSNSVRRIQTANFTVKDPQIQKVTGSSDPVQVMAKLREMKNSS